MCEKQYREDALFAVAACPSEREELVIFKRKIRELENVAVFGVETVANFLCVSKNPNLKIVSDLFQVAGGFCVRKGIS